MCQWRGLCCCMRTKDGESGGGGDNNLSKVTNNSGDEAKDQDQACVAPVPAEVAESPAGGKGAKKGATMPKVAKGGSPSAVLIEHFTSQGCSSCPPADALMSKLGRGQGADALELPAPVLVLSYHVDYWDYLGWKDPFASPKWTLRQRSYCQVLQQDSIYTPEVVVQGRSHCSGSNSSQLTNLVQAAPRFPAADISASFTQPSQAEMHVALSVGLRSKVEGYKLDVMVAIFENGLVTDCSKGENKGRVLTNDFVVTGLEKACTLENLPAKKAAKGEVIFNLWESFARSKCGIVVFLQNPETLEVSSAQKIDLPDHIN